MLALLAPSWRRQERTRPERLRRMCHRASASDREESAWVVGRGRPERERRRLARAGSTSASLLRMAEVPGKQQFKRFFSHYNRLIESEQSVRQKCHGALETARAKQLRTLRRSERECPRCGRKFSPKRIDGRYCSAACKQAAYRCRTVGKLTHSRGLYGRRLAQT